MPDALITSHGRGGLEGVAYLAAIPASHSGVSISLEMDPSVIQDLLFKDEHLGPVGALAPACLGLVKSFQVDLEDFLHLMAIESRVVQSDMYA